MKLNRVLAQEAAKHNICEDWYNEMLETKDKERLIKMYLKGIDFCLSNEYPTLSFIRENFAGVMEKYGVFLDDKINTENFRHVVALGNCEGIATYTGFGAGQVFVKHNSKLTIMASGNSFVMVDVFDDAEIEVEATENAKICINHYGGTINKNTSSVPGNGVIKIVHKCSKTY